MHMVSHSTCSQLASSQCQVSCSRCVMMLTRMNSQHCDDHDAAAQVAVHRRVHHSSAAQRHIDGHAALSECISCTMAAARQSGFVTGTKMATASKPTVSACGAAATSAYTVPVEKCDDALTKPMSARTRWRCDHDVTTQLAPAHPDAAESHAKVHRGGRCCSLQRCEPTATLSCSR